MHRRAIDTYERPKTAGIDVSRYQGDIDWPAVAADRQGFHFAVVRSSDGVDIDPRAVENLRGAHEAGLTVGTYHYVRASHTPGEQVDIIERVIRDAGVLPAFVALDLEGEPDRPDTDEDESDGAWWHPQHEQADVGTVDVLECLASLVHRLEEAGHKVLLYTGRSWHWFVGQSVDPQIEHLRSIFSDLPPWVPSYGSPSRPPLMPVDREGKGAPWSEWTLHQWTSRLSVEGISTPVDGNWFRGDEDEFLRWSQESRSSAERTPPG